MQDRPDAHELLTEVARILRRPNSSSPSRFELRVAANVCAIVARELEAGDAPIRDEARRLAELLPSTVDSSDLRGSVRGLQRTLALTLRAGIMDDRLADVSAALRASLLDRLAVASPTWAHFSDDGGITGARISQSDD
jgi:predicted DNA-binding protein (UPF0278 family)